MSLNHPSLAYRVREMDRVALLAEVDQGSRVAQASRLFARTPACTAPAHGRLGKALIVIGQRLQDGHRSVGHAATPIVRVAVTFQD